MILLVLVIAVRSHPFSQPACCLWPCVKERFAGLGIDHLKLEFCLHLGLYTNFFVPTMKLKSKQRVGSRVKKSYDQALTPYQRVLQSKLVSEAKKELLRAKYATLNPAALKRKLEHLQQRLDKTTSRTNWRECARMAAVTTA